MGRGGGAGGGGGGGRGFSGGAGGGRGFAGHSGGGGGSSSGRGGGYASGGPARGGGSMGPRAPMPGGMPGMGMPPGGMGRMPMRRGPVRGGMPAMGCTGCFMPFGSIVLVILIIALVMVCFGACSVGSGDTVVQGDGIERVKLESSLCNTSNQWIDDELGWLSDERSVRNAMQDFYDKTGVQPYLIITDNINGKGGDVSDSEVEAYLDEVYDSLYNDEGHMIFLFDEYSYSRYLCYLYPGSAAKSVMDSSAEEIFFNIVDRYYNYNMTDDEYFSKIFTESAEVLMKDYTANTRSRTIIMVVLIAAIAIVVALLIWRHIQDSKTKEAEHMKEILDTDIGASPSQEELLKKYGGDSDSGGSKPPDTGGSGTA